ncbi:aminoglycoside phosphotransferase (APT) family kinase protein [Methanomicrobium sp. W14]|uniref:phosphotransferase family protein n=1 Tax=Methanomicrobium sp. W14 TaxID=2817839 RepID=UPI001AE56912|nr:phosphotransferase [Methanomicrobium sp. W14]MBP2133393.1 aminoglycoside phosphotransferase (APT) family kinase protein [Methanomicrobium sp. W14]
MEQLREIEDTIFAFTGCKGVERIEKGFSFDKKYLVFGDSGKKYILRISPLSEAGILDKKKAEFEVIKRVSSVSSLVPKTYYFGVSGDESFCYMLLDYISGDDGEESLPKLSGDVQYDLGCSAGRELSKIHGVDAPAGTDGWYEHQSEKMKKKWDAFKESGIKTGIIDIDRLSGYLLENESCMNCKRQSFLHGDYHPGNLIVTDKKLSGIVDFNRYGWGDPVYDFLKAGYFTTQVSVPFARGQVDGYNSGRPSSEFWKKYAFYVAAMIIPDILWSHWYSLKTGSPDQTELSWERVKRVYSDHDGFESDVPVWYSE